MSFLPGFGRSATKPQSAKADTSATTTVAGIEKPTPHLQTVPYTVRVRSSFKGEVIALRTELQAERQNKHGATRRVTEREIWSRPSMPIRVFVATEVAPLVRTGFPL